MPRVSDRMGESLAWCQQRVNAPNHRGPDSPGKEGQDCPSHFPSVPQFPGEDFNGGGTKSLQFIKPYDVVSCSVETCFETAGRAVPYVKAGI